MTRMYRILLLLPLVAVGTACVETPDPVAREPGIEQGVYGGREYGIHTPPTIQRPGEAPAVILLHGGRSDGRTLRELISFERSAARHGVVAVYPSAPGNTWNDGRGVELGSEAGRDDAGYLADLIEHLGQSGQIDPSRVYFAGISNGGGMSIRMACEYPDLVAGIAVIATKVLTELSCEHYEPVPTAFFHGTEDRISPHSGRPTGREGVGRANKGRTLSSAATIALWSDRNSCAENPEERYTDTSPNDGSSVRVQRFTNCEAPLVYYEIDGGGHTWPGASRPDSRLLRRLLGPTNQDINANDEMLELWFGHQTDEPD